MTTERAIVDGMLARILGPELGYVSDRWPEVLYELVRTWAEQAGTDETSALEGLSRRADSAKWTALVDAATVRHTSFFRHPEQFEHLRRLLPTLAKKGRRPLDVWSAGCASGEEVYSLALCAAEVGVAVRILGTDVSAQAIQTARVGRYPARRSGGIPGHSTTLPWEAPDSLKRVVRFEIASLVGGSREKGVGPFDLIFCRNLLIYFEREKTAAILQNLVSHLRPDGSIVVSPGDSVLPLPAFLKRGGAIGWLRSHDAVSEQAPASRRPRASIPTRPKPDTMLEEAARLLGSGDQAGAEIRLRELVDRDIDSLAAWFLLGESLLQRGERAQAAVAFKRAATCTVHDDAIDGEALKAAALRRAESLSTTRRERA